jgi:thioester reductase-like protein
MLCYYIILFRLLISRYCQTKAIAERLVMQAKRHFGLEVVVFRPCDISSSTVNGYSNLRYEFRDICYSVTHS